ncbi:galactarate dehydratase [Alicycliphilus sp. B1]|nr:galactarate dehydratase [Alicycliphilus sp. B1]
MNTQAPLSITMHPADNVAIVANDGGLPAGAVLPGGLVLLDRVPQAHKVALVDIPEGGAVRRYNVVIGYALRPIPAGSWVHERLLQDARCARAGRPAHRHHPPRAAGAAGRLHLRGLPQRRRLRWARATSWPSRRRCSAWPG